MASNNTKQKANTIELKKDTNETNCALMQFFYASLIFLFIICLIINIKHTVAAGIQPAVTLRAALTVFEHLGQAATSSSLS